MIIDACMFAGELSMWWFRHQILNPVVDHFVIAENSWTHQGQPRERVFYDECANVHPFLLNIQGDVANREIEIEHRNAIADCCAGFSDDDTVIFGDVDEIPSRESVRALSGMSLPRTCDLDFYYYRLNHLRPETCGLIISTVKQLREVRGEKLRNLRGTSPPIGVKPSGWHLSYFGGTEAIQKKLSTFCHDWFNKPEFMDKEWLEECQRTGKGLLKCGTQCLKATPKDFPQYFLDAAPKEWWL